MMKDIESNKYGAVSEDQCDQAFCDLSQSTKNSDIDIVENAFERQSEEERNGPNKFLAALTLPFAMFGAGTTTIPEQQFNEYANKSPTEIVQVVDETGDQNTLKDLGEASLDIAEQVADTYKDQADNQQLQEEFDAAAAQEALSAPISGDPPADSSVPYEYDFETNTLTLYADQQSPTEETGVSELPIEEDGLDDAPLEDSTWNEDLSEDVEIFEESDLSIDTDNDLE